MTEKKQLQVTSLQEFSQTRSFRNTNPFGDLTKGGSWKNWRLTQLMSRLESNLPVGDKRSGGATVTYKNVSINNPLVGFTQEISLFGDPQRDLRSGDQLANLHSFTERNLKRFPVQADFVAKWLSENIVNSKAYKLSVLCDRVIKIAPFGKVFPYIHEGAQKDLNSSVDKTDPRSKGSPKGLGLPRGLTLIGLKIIISGRILGAEIATSKTFKAGRIPSNTIDILKDAGFALAKTRSGTIGIKVIYFWAPERSRSQNGAVKQ